MDPWWAKGAVLAATVALIAIRAPHGQRSRGVPVARSFRSPLETGLLTLAWIGFFLPLLWVATSWFGFAERPLDPYTYGAGVVVTVLGLWLFHRSHADLGTNWSITLELRERHTLVTQGVYKRIRHPMYAALLLYSAGHALFVPNSVAGPAYLVAMGLLYALRVGPEERMMRAQFGAQYDAYVASTRRLVPGLW